MPVSTSADSKTESSKVAPLAISLPKVGVAIRSMGEKFSANPVTDHGQMTAPGIATSSRRSSFGRQLPLSYNSGADNGPFSFGWNLSRPAITRIADKDLSHYVEAEKSGVILLAGAGDLASELKRDTDGHCCRFTPGGRINATIRCLSRA
jgi:hypothetical protein